MVFTKLYSLSLMEKFHEHFLGLQQKITKELGFLEGKSFKKRTWKAESPLFGQGLCELLEGNLLEKAAINTSNVEGEISKPLEAEMRMRGKQYPANSTFKATGISLIVHPMNPFCPTVHSNCRYFEIHSENGQLLDRWIGGVMDLSPSFVFAEDCVHFHCILRELCLSFPSIADYSLFKRQADEYFYLPHRKEWRGIGGIFFDDMEITNENFEKVFDFARELGNCFFTAFLPILEKRSQMKCWNGKQKEWQEKRRSKYVEFNLLIDRGTKFGLESGGSAENVFVSLPLTARWEFPEFESAKGTQEAESEQIFSQEPRNWLEESKRVHE